MWFLITLLLIIKIFFVIERYWKPNQANKGKKEITAPSLLGSYIKEMNVILFSEPLLHKINRVYSGGLNIFFSTFSSSIHVYVCMWERICVSACMCVLLVTGISCRLSIWVAFPFLFFGKISVSRDGSSIPHGPWGWSWSTTHLDV